jgi:hypothetical protein
VDGGVELAGGRKLKTKGKKLKAEGKKLKATFCFALSALS